MAKNRITRKDIVEDKVLDLGRDYAKSLQSAVDANQRWLESFEPIKNAALAQLAISKDFKVSKSQKEFLQIKKLQEEVTIKANNALKAEQQLLVAKQKTQQSVIDTEKKSIALNTQKNRAQQRSIKLTEQEKLEIRILNRGKREAAVISSKLSTEYEKQSVKLTQLRRKYKDIALSQGESGKAAKRLRGEIQALDNRLKKVDASVGQFQRNVGNYTKAMQSARAAARQLASALGLVGGAFLVVQVARDAIKVLRDFEKQNATLSAVLQVNSEDMVALTQDAIRLGETTVKTAGQVTELQIAYARLGFEQDEIIDLTEATISGSIAMNAELDKTAELTGAIVNTFDDLSTTDAPEIIDILALSTAKSALNFEKLQTGIPIVAGAANAAGVPFTTLVALMGKLADAGIDVSTSSTAIRNIFIESASQGLNYGEILDKIKNSSDKLTSSTDEFGKRAAVSAAVLANNIDAVDELDVSLNKAAGTSKRMADKELDTLDGAIKLLRSAWEGYILRLDESTDSTLNLKNAVSFIATNLKQILSTIATAVKLWLAYKIAVQASRLQTFLMNKQLSLVRLNAIKGAQGVTIATTAWKRFNVALKANALFLVVGGIVALVSALNKLSPPLSEVVEETNKSTDAFLESKTAQENQAESLNTLADRYDVLSSKTELNKDEQKELDKIIKLIAKDVPSAVTEVDKYGKALVLNTKKIEEFNKENNKINKQLEKTLLKENREELAKLERQQERLNLRNKEAAGFYVEGVGQIANYNGVLKKQVQQGGKFATTLKAGNELTAEQLILVQRQIQLNTENIKKKKEFILSLTDEGKANKAAAEEAEILASKKKEDVLVVKQLRISISELEKNLKELTKNGYENLTQAQIDNIKTVRDSLDAKKKELNSILGITKANKNAAKAEKERLKAEEKLRNDAFKLSEFSIKSRIKEQEEISKNDKLGFEDRLDAINKQANLELELAKENATNKLQDIKGLKQEEIDFILSQNDKLINEQSKFSDEELLILRKFQDKKKEIQSGKENSEDNLEIERIKSNANIEKSIREKALNDELRIENEKFQTISSFAGFSEDQREKETEAHEKRIAEIKKRYAIEALQDQVKAIELLLESEDISAEKRAEIEALLAKKRKDISDLELKKYTENGEDRINTELKVTEQILEISQQLTNALGDLAGAIFDSRIQKIDEEIEANDEKYERLLENENLSEEDRERIEQKRELEREKLEKKKAEEQRKQAILQKSQAALNVVLQTSLGVISALAQVPKFDFGISASALAATIAGIGAVQLAAVLAQPIPKFATGTQDAPEGWAIVDELRPEVHTDKKGNIKSYGSSSGANMRYLDKGDKIYKSHDDYEKMLRASMLSSVDINNKKLNSFQANVSVNNNYDKLVDEMKLTRQAIKSQKQKLVLNIPKQDINHALWTANNRKWHG